jgi:outer membrane protein assembly factor BamB
VWSIGAGGVNDLLYHNGLLYATGGGVLSAVDPTTGTVFWEQNLETSEISSPAGGAGYIAVVSTKDKLYLVDEKNGDIVFERYIRRGSFGDPIVIGDTLYVLTNTSRLFSFRIHEKEKKRKKKTVEKR